jgi:aquaporin Z
MHDSMLSPSSQAPLVVSLLPDMGCAARLAIMRYVYGVTVPDGYGSTVACGAEMAISFFLMITVLFATSHKRLAPYNAYFLGVLIATYFTSEAPPSGMSTNPARTFGSVLDANDWHALRIYFIAPSMGMLTPGEVFLRVRQGRRPYCAKFHHANNERCIFHHAQHEV